MYIIMVYEINEKRVNKVLKIGREYLTWVQNSVLEGEITDAKFFKMKQELKKVKKNGEDSIIFYIFNSKLYTNREIMGREKGKGEFII